MRLIVVSDSHGDYNTFKKILIKHKDETEAVLFLGDGYTEYEKIKEEFQNIKFHAVKGNNDIFCDAPITTVVNYGEVRILMLHGHTAPVFFLDEKLTELAKENNAQFVLYGHTHIPKTDYLNGIHIMNPGSIRYPRGGSKKSYGVIDITDTSIFKFIIELGN